MTFTYCSMRSLHKNYKVNADWGGRVSPSAYFFSEITLTDFSEAWNWWSALNLSVKFNFGSYRPNTSLLYVEFKSNLIDI